MDDTGKTHTGSNITSFNAPYLDMLPGGPVEQYLPPHNAWVRCDDCLKWRRIPAELADSIEETKCTWYIIIHTMLDHFKDSCYADSLFYFYFLYNIYFCLLFIIPLVMQFIFSWEQYICRIVTLHLYLDGKDIYVGSLNFSIMIW